VYPRVVERGEIDPALDLELADFVLWQLMANLHELIVCRLGVTLEAAASDVTMMSDPATDRRYDQIVQIPQFGLGTWAHPRSHRMVDEG